MTAAKGATMDRNPAASLVQCWVEPSLKSDLTERARVLGLTLTAYVRLLLNAKVRVSVELEEQESNQ